MRLSRFISGCALVAATFVANAVSTAHATTWNAVTDFSTSTNPNGAWSYGEGNAGTSFTAFTQAFTNSGGPLTISGGSVQYWESSSSNFGVPLIGENFGPGVGTCCSTVLIPTGVLWIHPGQSDDAILRWTAPVAGIYSFSGTLALLDTSPTGVLAEGFKNGTLLGSTTLTSPAAVLSPPSFGPSVPFSGVVSLVAGDILTFAINNNGNFSDDSTALTLEISSSTPLPATLPLFASGLGVIGLLARRRKRMNSAAVAV
jgi:PEP-CTERM motif-containing protein